MTKLRIIKKIFNFNLEAFSEKEVIKTIRERAKKHKKRYNKNFYQDYSNFNNRLKKDNMEKKITLTKWQLEALHAMQNKKPVWISSSRLAGRNYFKNLIKQDYPELYKKYYLQPVKKDNWLEFNAVFIDEAQNAPKGFNPFWKNKELKDFKFKKCLKIF